MHRVLLSGLLFLLSAGFLCAQSPPDALKKYMDGDYNSAVSICLNELKSMPRDMNSYSVLGWSLIALNRYADALSYGEQALKIAPYDPRIVEIIGEADYYLGKNIEALGQFQRYAVLNPTGDRIDKVYYFMGEIYIRLKDYNHADIALSTAVYHSPNVSTWWARLGYAREMAGDLTYARQAYQKALSLNPSLTEASRGLARLGQGNQ